VMEGSPSLFDCTASIIKIGLSNERLQQVLKGVNANQFPS